MIYNNQGRNCKVRNFDDDGKRVESTYKRDDAYNYSHDKFKFSCIEHRVCICDNFKKTRCVEKAKMSVSW